MPLNMARHTGSLKTNGAVEGKLHSFLTTALDGGE